MTKKTKKPVVSEAVAEVVSEEAEVVSEETEVVSEETEVVSEETEVVSEETEVVSEETEAVTEVVSEGKKALIDALKTVSVKNISKGRFVQPSTNITLWPGETKPLSNDGWLDNQVNAGLLEIV